MEVLAGTRAQVFAGAKDPGPVLVKVTDSVGGVGRGPVSVTVTVHVVAWLTETVGGEQATVVVVGRSGREEHKPAGCEPPAASPMQVLAT